MTVSPAVNRNPCSSLNLTLTFADDSTDSCSTSNNASASAVTFSTSSIPNGFVCFNLNETFTANRSSGVVTSGHTDYPAIDWITHNGAGFDPNANYSRIWYQQTNATGTDGAGAGKLAARYLLVYPGYNCNQVSDYTTRSIYLQSCQSDVGGQCNTAWYSVASFQIAPGDSAPRSGFGIGDGGCIDFYGETLKDGGANAVSGSLRAAIVAAVIVGVLVA